MTRTVLITGATSGIGLGLAKACLAQGDTVIAAGRDPAKLAALAGTGLETVVLDVADQASITSAIADVIARFPELDTVVNNAGIQALIDFREPVAMAAVRAEIDTNLTGLIAVTAAVLPHLLTRPKARIVQVGSGLGYVPLNVAPVYSATKAAVHAFASALSAQLQGTSVEVITLVPPVVETDLHRHQGQRPKGAMTLEAFVAEAMAGMEKGAGEVPVGRAKILRIGARLAPGLFRGIINGKR